MPDTIEYAAPAIANLFPGKLIEPDGGTVADKVRIIIMADLAVIYGEVSPNGFRQVQTQRKIPLTAVRPHHARSGGWIITDADGREWEAIRGSGCGCGSPLKSMPSPPPIDLGPAPA